MKQYRKACLPTTPSIALPHAYSEIRVLLMILCILPVTSCSSERSFRGMEITFGGLERVAQNPPPPPTCISHSLNAKHKLSSILQGFQLTYFKNTPAIQNSTPPPSKIPGHGPEKHICFTAADSNFPSCSDEYIIWIY